MKIFLGSSFLPDPEARDYLTIVKTNRRSIKDFLVVRSFSGSIG